MSTKKNPLPEDIDKIQLHLDLQFDSFDMDAIMDVIDKCKELTWVKKAILTGMPKVLVLIDE